MIKPDDILTRDKDRDAKICNRFMDDSKTLDEIGLEFGMTAPSVHYILHKNKSLLILDRNFERAKRINVLKRILKNTKESLSTKRDTIDVLEQLRKENEGEVVTNFISQFFSIEPNSSVKTRLDEIQADR